MDKVDKWIKIMDEATEQIPKKIDQEIVVTAQSGIFDEKTKNKLIDHYGMMVERISQSDDRKSMCWNYNHDMISKALYEYSKSGLPLPTVTKMSNITGFSRKTIYKHLNQLSSVEHQTERKAVTDMNRDIILGMLLQRSTKQGDLKAMKIYLDATKGNEAASTTNYIQVNNIKLSVEQFQNLPTSTLDKIGSLIKEVESVEVLR